MNINTEAKIELDKALLEMYRLELEIQTAEEDLKRLRCELSQLDQEVSRQLDYEAFYLCPELLERGVLVEVGHPDFSKHLISFKPVVTLNEKSDRSEQPCSG